MKIIFLMGPKHSGKTCAGRELASLLGCGFTDLDEEIARQYRNSPRTLYVHGPDIFREAEVKTLASVMDHASGPFYEHSDFQVIAAGGGIIDNPAALALINKKPEGVTVFLEISAETAWERISRERELPPFLNQADNPEEAHRCLHERRSDAYRKFALLVINAENKNPVEIAHEISGSLPGKSI